MDEAFVLTVGALGVWTVGRRPVLVPSSAYDFRRFGLLVGNAGAPLDGVAWRRQTENLAYEAAAGLLHVGRDPQSGMLDEADLFLAVRAAGSRRLGRWQAEYAPTLVASDLVDSAGWAVPFRLRSDTDLIEGEVARYHLTGTNVVPAGWQTAWIVRYAPHRPLAFPLQSVEAASIDPFFLPYFGNFGDRGGSLSWRPGERGIVVGLHSPVGDWEVGWKRALSWTGASGLAAADSTRLTWFPAVPEPHGRGSVSLVQNRGAWEVVLQAAAGLRF